MSTPYEIFGTLFRDYLRRLNVPEPDKASILLAALQAAGYSGDEAMIHVLTHHRHLLHYADPWLRPIPMGGAP